MAMTTDEIRALLMVIPWNDAHPDDSVWDDLRMISDEGPDELAQCLQFAANHRMRPFRSVPPVSGIAGTIVHYAWDVGYKRTSVLVPSALPIRMREQGGKALKESADIVYQDLCYFCDIIGAFLALTPLIELEQSVEWSEEG